MKFRLLVMSVIALCAAAIATYACDGPQGQMMGNHSMSAMSGYNGGMMMRLPTIIQRAPQEELPADVEALREALRAEKEFKRTGPQLFDMETANALSKKTGKPVLCWMGPHVFANAKARERSLALADTTIQAVMDSDGETKDAKGNPLPMHRVKFTDNGFYSRDSKVAFIPVAKLDESSDKKILSFTRGGK